MDLDINTESLLMELQESAEADALLVAGVAPVDALTVAGAACVRAYFAERKTNSDAQVLSEWHSYVEEQCSTRYSELRNDMPHASREEINATDQLLALNGLRRGIKQVMGERYRTIQASNRRPVTWPKSTMASVRF